jgi:hypothetical protein
MHICSDINRIRYEYKQTVRYMMIFHRLPTVIQSIYCVKYGETDDKEIRKVTKPNRYIFNLNSLSWSLLQLVGHQTGQWTEIRRRNKKLNILAHFYVNSIHHSLFRKELSLIVTTWCIADHPFFFHYILLLLPNGRAVAGWIDYTGEHMSWRQKFIFISLENFHANIHFDVLIYSFSPAPIVGRDTPPGLDSHRTRADDIHFQASRHDKYPGPQAATAVNLHFQNIRSNKERKTFLLNIFPIWWYSFFVLPLLFGTRDCILPALRVCKSQLSATRPCEFLPPAAAPFMNVDPPPLYSVKYGHYFVASLNSALHKRASFTSGKKKVLNYFVHRLSQIRSECDEEDWNPCCCLKSDSACSAII